MIKHTKSLVAALVVAGIAGYVLVNYYHGNHVDTETVQHTYSGLQKVNEVNTINTELVIQKIHGLHQLVGIESTAEKTMTFSDSIYSSNGAIQDFFGNRTLEMIAQAHFKMGVDLSSIQSGDIVAYGQTLFIKLSKDQMQLISLDIPFDSIR